MYFDIRNKTFVAMADDESNFHQKEKKTSTYRPIF